MKSKILIIITAVMLLAGLSACDQSQVENPTDTTTPNTTTPASGAFVNVTPTGGSAENPATGSGNSTAPAVQPAGDYIGEGAAKTIALAKVPGAADSDIRIHLDYDDGIAVYEGSILYQEMEYEFEIRATDGEILEWSVESIYDN